VETWRWLSQDFHEQYLGAGKAHNKGKDKSWHEPRPGMARAIYRSGYVRPLEPMQ
jgi:hypothetical protein